MLKFGEAESPEADSAMEEHGISKDHQGGRGGRLKKFSQAHVALFLEVRVLI